MLAKLIRYVPSAVAILSAAALAVIPAAPAADFADAEPESAAVRVLAGHPADAAPDQPEPDCPDGEAAERLLEEEYSEKTYSGEELSGDETSADESAGTENTGDELPEAAPHGPNGTAAERRRKGPELPRRQEHLLYANDAGERENGSDIPAEDDSGLFENGTELPVPELPPQAEEPEGFVYFPGYYRPDADRHYAVPLSEELQAYTYEKCEEYGVPYRVVMGLMGVESGWTADIGVITNPSGRYVGLGMLSEKYNVPYFSALGIDIYTPKGNIEALCSALGDKFELFDYNIHYALMAYNQGNGGARESIAEGHETSSYSRKVMMFAENLLSREEWDAVE